MCGILGIFGVDAGNSAVVQMAVDASRRQEHRGGDGRGVYASGRAVLVHERLALVGVSSGQQPMQAANGSVTAAVAGEIYNHKALRGGKDSWSTESDSEVVVQLLASGDLSFVADLAGMFAFVAYDERSGGRFVAARDYIGITPLYMGEGADGSLWFASEMKVLAPHCQNFCQFPPGHIYDSSATKSLRRYAWQPWDSLFTHKPQTTFNRDELRHALSHSVASHLMADAPTTIGALLSGGVDSSLVASIASRLLLPLKTFSIGMEGSPDLHAARRVAKFLNTEHHEFTFTIEQGLAALRDTIAHIETFHAVTVRGSVPMLLLARHIRALGVKVVLAGEGADEVFGGYLYFHKAPDAAEFQRELVEKLRALHKTDCVRTSHAFMAAGVEVRVPFLDGEFVESAMSIEATRKMCRDEQTGASRMEKFYLREAFDQAEYLPDEILWRQKEQLSDGVGYGWTEALKRHAETKVDEMMMKEVKSRFPIKTPKSKEEYLYREIFEEMFPQNAAVESVPYGESIACSTPRAAQWLAKSELECDPSGRSVAWHTYRLH